MKRLWIILAGMCALGGAVFTSGCGPGLVAAGGGSIGAIFGLQGGDEEKKKDNPPPPSTNVVPAVVVTSLTREESPATINYTILDANNDLCSVEVQFAVGGGSFAPCFEGTGGDGTTGLASSAGGTAHTFSWDFVEDLGPQLTQNVDIRIRANDGTIDGSWFTLSGQNIGNDAPSLSNIQAFGTDTVLITFDFLDENSDSGSIDLFYSIDQGQSFIPVDPVEIIGNPPTNLQTSPAGSPNQFIWDSSIALLDYVGEVLLKFEPYDQPSGYSFQTFGPPVVEGPYNIDNAVNTPPELVLQSSYDAQTFVGSVPIDFTIQDDESDGAVVVVEFSLDGGSNYFYATLENQFAQGVAGPFPTDPAPTFYSTTWDALADIGQVGPYVNSYSNVVLRVTPGDAVLGTASVTDPFTLVGNEAPVIHAVDALQDSGNIPIVINVEDSSADPLSVLIEYSTDAVNYSPLSPSDFVFGNPDSLASSNIGEDNVLIWDSTIQFPVTNASSVTLRVTPTDHPPSATPTADLTGTAFVSSPFPIINDPAGADPVSIDVFTTDMAGTPTANPVVTVTGGGTVYFDREVNPSTATVTNTFWRIFETGGDYGTLLDETGAALVYATGSLSCAAPGSIVDGDTFTIGDGLNGSVTFEFDNNSLGVAGNELIDFSTAASADDVAVAVANAINANPFVRIIASPTAGGFMNLTHEFACALGNAVVNGGNATNISFTGTCLNGVSQLAGGAGNQRLRFDAPATPPAGTDYVTLICAIDDPAYYTSVWKAYRLYWGDAPTSVSVSPSSTTVLVNGTEAFTATVLPAGAPQIVEWQVVGGTANGTISPSGVYTAPAVVPATNPVTIRAFCVDPSVPAGTASVTIQPEPASITVNPPASNPPAWDPPDLQLGETIAFTATVNPANAPQGVNWRIIWDNQDWGSGNSTVGTIDSSGNYTAPNSLPSPDQIQIQAVSQVKPSVFGAYNLRLKAPPPTSFTVSPTTATVTAGGAGQQFVTQNFIPSNANTAVTWEINPQVGSISSSGYYTPPLTASTSQVVTVTAKSVPAPSVTASAVVTVQPNQSTPPSSLVITPDEGITTSGGQDIQFSATVFPTSAPQTVSWSFVGPAFGSIDQTGKYTPNHTDTDRNVTIRCESTVDTAVFDTVDVCITGDDRNWVETDNIVIGRGDHTTVWDSFNSRLWVLGGHSELTGTGEMELGVYFIEYGVTPFVEGYDSIPGGSKATVNTVAAVYDPLNDRILAFLGQGSSDDVEVWELDVTNVPTATWQQLTFSSSSDVPRLDKGYRYHCWYNYDSDRVNILVGNNVVYRFECSGGSKDTWDSRKFLGKTNDAPVNPEITALAIDDTGARPRPFFIGAEDSSTGAAHEVWWLDLGGWRWEIQNVLGSPPARGLVNASAYYHAGTFWVFGGREADKVGLTSDLYSFTESGGDTTWTQETLGSTSHTPLPRGDAFFGLGLSGPFLIGGENPNGTFGDFWEFNETTIEFYPFNPEGILPQGRHSACGAMKGGEAWTYGGICHHGVSNELWHMWYDDINQVPVWTKVDTFGDRPPSLRDASMVYDDFNNVLILFGGNTTPGNTAGFENETYEFDFTTDTWTLLSPGSKPTARHGHAACFDSTREVMWIYGGETASGLVTDIARLDLSGGTAGATWTTVAPSGGSSPDPRKNATMGYDSRADRLLVLGGDSSVSGPNRQLFAFSISAQNWSPLSTSNTGSDRNVNRTSAVYDDGCRRFLTLPSLVKSAQAVVVTSNGPTWQYLNPPLSNNASGGTGLYDPISQRYYSVFGQRLISGRNVGTNQFKKVDFK